ncbi:TfoX/Sxy family protein [Treponema porcinum]|uniref:TfoX/Sxy family protein n=1 Tax=Treponema porcinum TaxID=261392 RepID=UPI002354C3AB|nr:TfoX/Sxy family protein [Treponema porcinum]MCI6722601.1 TfoX/Sxy family protein [Treponema porcinum]MCI7534735.1 TfoX/Sxy family protein [Treponema porcinum]
MATSKEYIDFILDQLSSLEGITFRKMMGEYIIYLNEKIAAYACDDRLLVKITPTAQKMLPGAPAEPPYDGAKDMLLVENVDDREFLANLFTALEPEMTLPKKKKPRK